MVTHRNQFRQRVRQWWKELSVDVAVNKVLGADIVPRPLRWRGMRALGMAVEQSVISQSVYFGTRRVTIGRGVRIGREVHFDGAAEIILGERAGIGPQSMLITGGHEIGGPRDRVGPLVPRPIVIGPGAWLGVRVLVLPGVTIGAGCVIGAGSTVTRDCAPHGVYVGSPAVRIRDLPGDRVRSSITT